jgi:hypothetical protein
MIALPGPLSLSTSSLQLQTEETGSTHASQTNFKGPFVVITTTCGGIANVGSAQSASGDFTVTAVGPGTCSLTIGGGTNARATLNVTVTRRPVPMPEPGAPPKKH